MIADDQHYPDSARYKAEFVAMTYQWRPAFACFRCSRIEMSFMTPTMSG